MSIMFYGQDDLGPVRRLVWGRLFGQCVGKTRQAAGRSVEDAAGLAGMEASEWASVEAGFVPDPAQLRPMADALQLGNDRIATMAMLCRAAGSSKPLLPPPRTFRGTGGGPRPHRDLIGAIAELERSLIVARLEGQRIGRFAGTGLCRNPTRSTTRPEYQRDRQRASRFDGHHKTRPSKDGLNRTLQPSDKRVQKIPQPNSTKQMAGSQRSGRVKRCGLGYEF